MNQATGEVTDEMRKREEEHLKAVHKQQVENMASRGAKHSMDSAGKKSAEDKRDISEIAIMKMRAAQGCPHAAKYLKDLEAEKVKNSKWDPDLGPPIEDRIVGSSHDDEYSIEELEGMAAKGDGLARAKLAEIKANEKPDIEQLKAMAEQGCPMARAKLAKINAENNKPDVEQLKAMAAQGCPMAKAKLKELEGRHDKTLYTLQLNRMNSFSG